MLVKHLTVVTVILVWFSRVINALDETVPEFSVTMETEGGSDSECFAVPFHAPDLMFMSISNLTNVTVGKYV